MKKIYFFIFLISILLLVGCSKKLAFEDFFHATMNEMHEGEKDYSYSLIYTKLNVIHENDAIAIFKENKLQEETIFIAYFEKQKNKWYWMQTRGSRWDSPCNWSSMNPSSYIYSGAINDTSISEVSVNEKNAKIIKVEDYKRFWYAICNINDAQVKFINDDGVQKIVKELDWD